MKFSPGYFPVFLFLIVVSLSGIAAEAGVQEIRLEPGKNGNTVLVAFLQEQSVFEKAGLHERDEITEIDFTPVGEMTFSQAASAVSGANIPGSSIILSVTGPEGTRLIYISSPMPDRMQETFLIADREIMEAWEISRVGWEFFIDAACEFALGRKKPRDLFKAFRSSRSAFTDSRNSLISIEIPSLLPSRVRSDLSRSKSRLADANTLRYFATRILYRSLVAGENPVSDEQTPPTAYPAAYLIQGIKSRLVSETEIPGIDRAWDYLRNIYLQVRTPDEDKDPLAEKLVREADMAVTEARDRIERISDLGALMEEAISYFASAEYGAAALLGKMLLRYSAVEKKANIAAGEGFGYLMKARSAMGSR